MAIVVRAKAAQFCSCNETVSTGTDIKPCADAQPTPKPRTEHRSTRQKPDVA
jgi:hypothetical protein